MYAKKPRTPVVRSLMSLLLALSLSLALALPATAVPADYNTQDVAAINAIISGNSLSATPDDPDSWTTFATWDSASPKRLIELNLDSRSLTGVLDVSSLTALTTLHLNNNALTGITGLDQLSQLSVLTAEHNTLSAVDVSYNTQLTELNLASNQLSALDVTQNTGLLRLYCDDNQISTLELSRNPALELLYCQTNQLTELDLSANTQLKELRCQSNQLSRLNVSACTQLEKLYCRRNELTALDVRSNTNLTDLECGNNSLTQLDVTQNTALTRLACQTNNLTSLDVSHNTQLRILVLLNNRLKNLDLSALGQLSTLYCNYNPLTGLDLSYNPLLRSLYCPHVGLTNLDLSHNPQLTILDCVRGNQIADLDLSHQTDSNAFVFFGSGLDETGFSTQGKHVLQVACPTGTEDYDIENFDDQNNLTLVIHSETFQRWEMSPAISSLDLTDNPLALAIPQGVTTLTPVCGDTPVPPTAPTITTTALPDATVGTPYSCQLTASGTSPITFSAANLPDGLSLSSDGLLSGTPTAAGSYSITVTAANAADSAQATLSLTVTQSGTSGGGSTGGGGTGGGSGSTPSTPEVSTQGGQSTALLTPKPTVSGTSSNVILTSASIQSGIDAAEKAAGESGTAGVVEVQIDAASASDIKATFPTDSLEAIAQSQVDALRLSSQIGTVELDQAALSAVAQSARGSQISLEIDVLGASDLSAQQQDLVGDRPVYRFTVASAGTEIHSLGSGSAQVTLPYTLQEGENPQDIVIYYLYERGGLDGPRETLLEPMHAVYDPERGTVEFLTAHFSLYTVSTWANPFADVSREDWYFEDVRFAQINRLLIGTAADAFSPQEPVTRATVATLLYRLAGEPAAEETSLFDDVTEGTWYYDAIQWAAQVGVAQGVGGGRFDPDAPVSRQDLAVFLWRYMAYAGIESPITQEYIVFADQKDIADYAQQAVQALCKLGILQGVGQNSIRPLDGASRAEAAAMLHRLLAEPVHTD